jgi:alginate O-acetyltransferase complex protein AlgI
VTFTSFEYVVLLVSVFLLYWRLPRVGQNVLLLIASYVFYAYVHTWLAFLILGYTAVNYFAAYQIGARPEHRQKFLLLAVISGLGVLGIFKYLGFFVENITSLLSVIGLAENSTTLRLFLPAGISFYTFQTLGYVIDVHQGRTRARTNFFDVALYVAFFPQVVAGPIERATRLLPQFERKRSFDPDRVRNGIYLIMWGFFKKLVIADNVAVVADKVFSLQEPSVSLLAVGVLAFGIQIFADFSGYTDIARGSAKILGINLTANFNNPYASRSPTDFWRRWHISLSTWFRDYVYIPLGGSRSGARRNVINLMITFLLTGLWHGAAWNFVLWGGYHGALILLDRFLSSRIPMSGMLARVAGIFLTFVLIQFGWLLFRARDLGIIWDSLSAQLNGSAVGDAAGTAFLFFLVLVYSSPLWAHNFYQQIRHSKSLGIPLLKVNSAPVMTSMSIVLLVGILLMKTQDSGDFIYFEF